jgi:hypothetical protein
MPIRIRYLQIDGRNVLDPATLGDLDFPGAPDIGRANSIHNPRGPYPGSAWILVDRETVDALEQTRNSSHTFKWYDYEEGRSPAYVEFRGYYLIQSYAIDQDGDENSAYLVELQDMRCLLWRSPAVNKAYNVPRPVPIWHETATSAEVDVIYSEYIPSVGDLCASLWGQLPAAFNAGSTPTYSGENDTVWGPLDQRRNQRLAGVL